MREMNASDFQNAIKAKQSQLLDTRTSTEFIDGHIPGSIFIPDDSKFEHRAKLLLNSNLPILLIADKNDGEAIVQKLNKIGFDQDINVLKDGFEDWKNAGLPIDMLIEIEADELAMDLPFDKNIQVIDVRKEEDFDKQHVDGAMHIDLPEFKDLVNIAQFEDNQHLYLHCGGGNSSTIAASLFKLHGLHNLRVIKDGWKAISKEERIPKTK